MKRSWEISRRTVLRGLGTALALPALDVMTPSIARAQAAGDLPTNRMLFFFVPNGMYMDAFEPEGEGTDYQMSPTLLPLEPYRDDILIVSGLDNRCGEADIAGNHARGTAAFLTCVPPVKNPDMSPEVGISADQIIANEIGRQTRFASLEFGAEPPVVAGSCDSGYSCSYISNISWAGPETPMSKEVDPQQAFDRLFGSNNPGENAEQLARRGRYKKSILDFVAEDTRTLQAKLGSNDRQKLDEYLTGVRTLEQRIANSQAMCANEGLPASAVNRQETVQQMCDIIALAFQCDLTRVGTFMLANGFTNVAYHFLGVGEGHHELSHHRGQRVAIDHLKTIDRWEVEQFAYLVGRLKSIPEGDGTLLDNCTVMFGSELSDGNNHRHNNLPVILAGRGGGTIRPGRHFWYKGAGGEFPIGDLFLTLMHNMGVERETFGRGLDGAPYGTKLLTELA